MTITITNIELKGLEKALEYLKATTLPAELHIAVQSNLNQIGPVVEQAEALETEIAEAHGVAGLEENDGSDAFRAYKENHLGLLMETETVEQIVPIPWEILQRIEIPFQHLCGLRPVIGGIPDEAREMLDYYQIDEKDRQQIIDQI